MLKISVIDTKTQRRLVLEGCLIAPWTSELRNVAQKVAAELGDRELVVDVRNLTTIREDGEAALLELMKQGARFLSLGMFTRHVLKRLARTARPMRKETKE